MLDLGVLVRFSRGDLGLAFDGDVHESGV
jgi:hypothetical protein